MNVCTKFFANPILFFSQKKHKYQPHGAARGKLRGTQMFLQSFTAIHPVVEITLDQNGGPTD